MEQNSLLERSWNGRAFSVERSSFEKKAQMLKTEKCIIYRYLIPASKRSV